MTKIKKTWKTITKKLKLFKNSYKNHKNLKLHKKQKTPKIQKNNKKGETVGDQKFGLNTPSVNETVLIITVNCIKFNCLLKLILRVTR